ncbi:MaoC/PaaZ C-terminal domain-containing protein [Thalassotalea sp. Y01]|uniref:MaoC/PaaZ C-terminal domain-containing protein n=1 Tax=Thalassotalea sp. Y01 TaxID=2729613 RepID=UPI00145D927D|nr:MaoC/PaaZ C-terminal domain-containing protein [Thalassotalea sp. Y01]NMP17400.1 hypothetical protein [Thalassotalea sp. Y01]
MYHYLKLLTKRRRKVFFNEFTVDYDVNGIKDKHLSAFRRFYSLEGHQTLPVSYAFIAGFKPMMKALGHKHFAFSPIGLIHLTADFRQSKPIDYRSPFKVDIKVKQNRRHPLGKLIQVESKFYQDEQLCVINTNSMLKKLKTMDNKAASKNMQSFNEPTSMHINADLARSYAKISYDYNPIHISKHLAKLFGLPGTIMHGMYFAHLLLINHDIDNSRVKFEFKKPCLLPTDIGFAKVDEQYQVFSGCDDLHLNLKLFSSS